MDALWASEGLRSVRDVHEELSAERDLAYTTILTVLDRLAKKGHVTRERSGRAWLYRAAESRASLLATAMLDNLEGTEEQRRAVLQVVVDRLPRSNVEFLREALG